MKYLFLLVLAVSMLSLTGCSTTLTPTHHCTADLETEHLVPNDGDPKAYLRYGDGDPFN